MAVPERNRWDGAMSGPTADLAEHFPKTCSNDQCALGGDIKLMAHPPMQHQGTMMCM
jgi:hypothetical protein